MRSKTIILGLLAVAVTAVLSAGRPRGAAVEYGYAPGEQLPSVEVDGVRWLSDLQYDSLSYVVVWSKDDAIARAVNARVSQSEAKTYSICVDASPSDARVIALLDHVSPKAELLGAQSEKADQEDLKALRTNAEGCLFVVCNGVIRQTLQTSEIWPLLASGADQLKEPADLAALML